MATKYSDMDDEQRESYYSIVGAYENGRLGIAIDYIADINEIFNVIHDGIKRSYDINCVPRNLIGDLKELEGGCKSLIEISNKILGQLVADIKAGRLHKIQVVDEITVVEGVHRKMTELLDGMKFDYQLPGNSRLEGASNTGHLNCRNCNGYGYIWTFGDKKISCNVCGGTGKDPKWE